MAKVKTPKKEKIVDLKPKVEKLPEDQLKEIQQTITVANRMKLEVGNIEARKHAILHELDTVNSKITEFNDKLKEEYGNVDVDIATGTIRYLSDEQADS
tara:strand:+ start:23 stop:319 length:297 start_codon:yes stop_codon:yes gene_type:complete